METNIVTNVVPNQTPVIPPDWASLGVVSGYNPPTPEKLRLLIDGPEGEGKSTFVASMPNNLILDFEGGAGGIVGPKSKRVRITGFDHFMKIHEKLVADAKSTTPYFKRVSYDGADRWSEMWARQCAKELSERSKTDVMDIADYGSHGAGYRVLKNRAWRNIQEIEEAGYGWAIIGHITDETITDPTNPKKEITVPRLALIKSLRTPLCQSCDFHATIYSQTTEATSTYKALVDVGGGKFVETDMPGKSVFTTIYKFNCVSVGGKTGKARGVPDMETRFELPLIGGWDLFVQKYNQAVTKAKGKVS